MKQTWSNQHAVVFDGFLSATEFEALWRCVQQSHYKAVHADGWQKVWGLSDGQPLQGPHLYFQADEKAGETISMATAARDLALTIFANKLRKLSDQLTGWIGKRGSDWKEFTCTPYLYPPGTALSWHDDRASRTGAFAFYAHPKWNPRWGGELMISDSHSRGGRGRRKIQEKDFGQTEWFTKRIATPGTGSYVMPMPNRLVILRGGTIHKINHTVAAAGAPPRCSVSGFFQK